MRYLPKILTALILVAAVGVALGSVSEGENKPDGAALYKTKCSMCHGADGKGFAAIKTPDFTDPKVQASITDKDMVTIIKQGKKGTPMLGFADKLKEDEIDALVKYIRSLSTAKNGKKK